jgi:hypothetical protein
MPASIRRGQPWTTAHTSHASRYAAPAGPGVGRCVDLLRGGAQASARGADTREGPLDLKIVALLLFVIVAASAIGGSLVWYGRSERQRGWIILGWAIIVLWVGSTIYVLARYAIEQG